MVGSSWYLPRTAASNVIPQLTLVGRTKDPDFGYLEVDIKQALNFH